MIKEWDCCDAPDPDPVQVDLGTKGGLEFILFHCRNCDAYWMNVFSVASNTAGFERISHVEVKKMFNLPSEDELKEFLYNWFWGTNRKKP